MSTRIVGVVALVTVALVFSCVGEIRNPRASVIRKWARLAPNYPAILPEEFIWFYLYLTSPLSNVVYNIDNLAPTYPDFRYWEMKTTKFAINTTASD